MAETAGQRQTRFSRIWLNSRIAAGRTQTYMAEKLGVSKKTIQNWESGVTSPDLFTGSEWFRALGISPLPYYLAFLFPDLFDGPGPEDEDTVDEALRVIIKNCSTAEKRQLLYLMAGQHGSPWHSLLQVFTAYCHTSMQSRVTAATAIASNFELEQAREGLVCADAAMPDMNMLKSSVAQARRSVMNGMSGYSMAGLDTGEEVNI